MKQVGYKECSGRKLQTGKYFYLFNYSAILAQVWILSPLMKDVEGGLKIRTFLEESVIYFMVLQENIC